MNSQTVLSIIFPHLLFSPVGVLINDIGGNDLKVNRRILLASCLIVPMILGAISCLSFALAEDPTPKTLKSGERTLYTSPNLTHMSDEEYDQKCQGITGITSASLTAVQLRDCWLEAELREKEGADD